MANYLERYQQGEHQQVWRELVALGEQVRSEPHYSDACAVARETMRRVRQNVEIIHAKLRTIGYRFQFPERAISPRPDGQIPDLDEFERQVGHLPLSLRAWAEVVGSVNFMGNYPKLSFCAETYNPFIGARFAVGGPGGQTQVADIASLMPTQEELEAVPPEYDDALSGIFGAFANLTGQNPRGANERKQTPPEQAPTEEEDEQMGQMQNVMQDVLANMQQSFQQAADPNREKNERGIPPEDQVLSDPLVVEFNGLSREDYEAWQELEEEDIPFSIIISPDAAEKANRAGDASYLVELPDAAADVLIRNTAGEDMLFVEYLRSSLEWAGFRELRNDARRDDALLKSLKEGLLPF